MMIGAQLNARTQRVVDRDPKRFFWVLGLIVPLLPLIAISRYESTGWIGHLYLPAFVIFVVIPIQDLMFGTDDDNLSEQRMTAITDSRFYRILVDLYVPMQWVTYGVAVYWFANRDLTTAEIIGAAVSVGLVAGIAINAAHEMGHKPTRYRQWLARVSLAQSAYGHFFVEHNRGHHRNVSTPEDPASSRYGESLWAFLPRTVINSARSAWRLEADRLARNGLPAWHRTNKNLQSWAMTVAVFAATIAYAGPSIIWFLVIQTVVGFFLLEVVNYIEHYGLLRQKLANGNYERCKPEHSWNSNYRVTNIFLFHLQRHSDHHANPTRPYQILRNMEGAPNLPAGYAAMVVLAMFPPLWFAVMNPRVRAHYDGDLSRANLTRRQQRRLVAAGTRPV